MGSKSLFIDILIRQTFLNLNKLRLRKKNFLCGYVRASFEVCYSFIMHLFVYKNLLFNCLSYKYYNMMRLKTHNLCAKYIYYLEIYVKKYLVPKGEIFR